MWPAPLPLGPQEAALRQTAALLKGSAQIDPEIVLNLAHYLAVLAKAL
jgi:hypothetical protein